MPVSQVPKLVEVPEVKPEPKQVPMLQWPSQAVLEIKGQQAMVGPPQPHLIST